MSQVTDHEAFYKKFISLTEWLDAAGHSDTAAIRAEDNEKRERLRVLNEIIGLPYDKPTQFTAEEVANKPPKFQKFIQEHGTELCAIRLIPLKPDVPKMRMRGKSIVEAVDWFDHQRIDPALYRVDFIPHPRDDKWATIFVVNAHGIFGEIIPGAHTQLTQGYQDAEGPVAFSFDFKSLATSRDHKVASQHLREIFAHLMVGDSRLREALAGKLQATFSHNYLNGYFETTASDDFGLVFIDYSRILGNLYKDFTGHAAPSTHRAALLTGQIGSSGRAAGQVRIIHNPSGAELRAGEILVCRMTTPDYLPLMQQAAAIVTDLGGILSHAAIVARELGKPCLTATGNATTTLSDGQKIIVDAESGIVKSAETQ